MDKTNSEFCSGEIRYKRLLSSITDHIYTVKVKNGKIISTIHASSCKAITGYTVKEFNSDPELWYKMVFAKDRENYLDQKDRLIAGEDVPPLEHRINHKNGSLIWVKQTLVPFFDKSQNIVEYTVLIENITNSKKAEQELKNSERKYRTIFENSYDIYYLVNLDGRVIDISPSVFKYTGVPREEFIGSSTGLFYKNPSQRAEYVKKITTDGEVIDYEVELMTKNKKSIFATINAHLLPDESGGMNLIEGFLHNITERKLSEIILKKLNQAVEQSPASIMITDTNGIIEYVNTRFITLTGYSPFEVIGKKARLLKPEKISPYDFNEVWTNITNGRPWRGEFFNRKKNRETFWESVLISPIINEKNEVTNFLIISEDISEKKKSLKELVEAKEEAEKSDKLKSEFLSQISHEIRTPINAIINFTYILKEELLEKNLVSNTYFNAIEESSKRIIRTVDLILKMSEIQTGNYNCSYKMINIFKDVVIKTFTEMGPKARKKNLHYSIDMPEDDAFVRGDLNSLEQIFYHLIENAIIYTPEGSIHVNCYKDQNGIPCVKIKDTGIGISEQFLPDLFKPFRQEHQGYSRKFDGNGLGLALAKKYCEMNNAEISVITKKNGGSEFTVQFRP